MQSVIVSKLTKKCQATIPENVRGILDLHPGDSIAFDVTGDRRVIIRKAIPIDFEFAQALEGVLASEWLSENDEDAYRDL